MSENENEHIDPILNSWPYEPSTLSVRIRKGRDGRDVLQMRLDLGLLQLETTGRPDGTTPGGKETYLHFLLAELSQHHKSQKASDDDEEGSGDRFMMSEE